MFVCLARRWMRREGGIRERRHYGFERASGKGKEPGLSDVRPGKRLSAGRGGKPGKVRQFADGFGRSGDRASERSARRWPATAGWRQAGGLRGRRIAAVGR